jgi:hypothetical protein
MSIKIKCNDFRSFKSNTLKGYATLELVDVWIAIDGYALHVKDGQRWLSPPRRSYVGKNGETVYADMMSYTSAEAKQEFQEAAL